MVRNNEYHDGNDGSDGFPVIFTLVIIFRSVSSRDSCPVRRTTGWNPYVSTLCPVTADESQVHAKVEPLDVL